MTEQSIYRDIAARTGGDIYIGVVGPVRTGKSTFIKKFMETLVLPHMESDYLKERAVDELPQSSAGRTIMTTEPKFIPEEAAEMTIDDASFRVRLIDCVGYIVPSSVGYFENDAPRMVRTPWFPEEVPFNMAAEVGTKKVIDDHCTIGLAVTTDGSFSDIPREEYEEAEARILEDLKQTKKPFVILLNSRTPSGKETEALRQKLEGKYQKPVRAVSCLDLTEEDIKNIIADILFEFPLKEAEIRLPSWLLGLPRDHWLKRSVFDSVKEAFASIKKLGQVTVLRELLKKHPHIAKAETVKLSPGKGAATAEITLLPELFYKVLGEVTDLSIEDESALIPCMAELAHCKREYDKLLPALKEVEATGYGIVMPQMEELSLEEPEILKQGSKYGVRLKASAPSIHLMRADITTEVNPIVGSEKQSEELIRYLLQEFEEDPHKIWQSNIFGKSLNDLVNEGLCQKLYRMPPDARMKLQETIERIINEGCSGLICLIL